MSQKDNVFSIKLIRKKGKLIPKTKTELGLMIDFVDGLEENQVVECFFEAYKDDGTNPQLAKIHVTIRKLASELGYTFMEMKNVIKKNSGLCYKLKDGSEYCKSFSECSKEELALVIEAINQAGDMINISY
jgi:hypothetical protein